MTNNRRLDLAGQVHVWPIRLTLSNADSTDALAKLHALLSEEETTRAARFKFAHLRESFVLAHGALRVLLARYVGTAPGDISFAYEAKGKPTIANEGSVHFNLSHSGSMALLAITRGCEVGVDIERIRSFSDMPRVAQRFFCVEESNELMALPADQRDLAFFRCWTRKEAYIKAVGDGLSVPLDSFRVTLQPGDPAKFVHLNHDAEAAAQWSLHNLEIAEGYAAALAYCSTPRQVEIMPVLEPENL
jgi:4'-phosphopantetheinyl transferase